MISSDVMFSFFPARQVVTSLKELHCGPDAAEPILVSSRQRNKRSRHPLPLLVTVPTCHPVRRCSPSNTPQRIRHQPLWKLRRLTQYAADRSFLLLHIGAYPRHWPPIFPKKLRSASDHR